MAELFIASSPRVAAPGSARDHQVARPRHADAVRAGSVRGRREGVARAGAPITTHTDEGRYGDDQQAFLTATACWRTGS